MKKSSYTILIMDGPIRPTYRVSILRQKLLASINILEKMDNIKSIYKGVVDKVSKNKEVRLWLY